MIAQCDSALRQGEPASAQTDSQAGFRFEAVIDEICAMPWERLSPGDMQAAAWAYYHVSVQFRESLMIACALYPADPKLQQLAAEECATDNLSPWPGVAGPGERLDHDAFLLRALALAPLDPQRVFDLRRLGEDYLVGIRLIDQQARAASVASYENGGLERVFRAMLRFESWDGELLLAFRHFLLRHVEFDSMPDGHGALCSHVAVDDAILPIWRAFADLLCASVPALALQARR